MSKIRSCEHACLYRYLQCFQGVGGSWGGVSIYIYIYTYMYICTYIGPQESGSGKENDGSRCSNRLGVGPI